MKYDIEALKRKMLVKYPFFGSVVAGVKYKEERSVGTAGTDGKTIYYNPDFLEKLSTDEQTFIFAHEVCHIAFNHILRSEGKNPQIWNTATDAVINQFLKRDGLKMVEGGVDIADAVNYDVEQLYNKMKQEQQQNQGGSGNGQQDQNNEQQDVGHDTHSMWEDAVKKHREERAKTFEKKESLLDRLLNRKKEEQSKEKTEIENVCKKELDLELNKKTQIGVAYNGIDFLGFNHILTNSGKVIRKLRFLSMPKDEETYKIDKKIKSQINNW